MKRYIIIITIISIILTGCYKSVTVNIDNNTVTSIIYDDISFVNNDFETIINKINNKTFFELFDNSITGEKLEIKTSIATYNFEVVDNYIIYTVDNHRFFTSTDELQTFLTNTVDKYKNNDFFYVELTHNYNIYNSDYLINIDDSDNYIVITSKLNMYNFKVKNIKDNNIYTISNNENINIESNKIICIRINIPEDILISFETPYNFEVDIVYDKQFIKNIKQNT